MFKKFKQKREIRRQNRLIKLAEENGIELPPECRPVKSRSQTQVKMKNTIYGWRTPRWVRAEIAERKLKERGIL